MSFSQGAAYRGKAALGAQPVVCGHSRSGWRGRGGHAGGAHAAAALGGPGAVGLNLGQWRSQRDCLGGRRPRRLSARAAVAQVQLPRKACKGLRFI